MLYYLIDLYLSQKKRIYCAFIDYKKAFDTIDRASLWYKMLTYNINAKVLKVLQNMYDKAKSCVLSDEGKSDFFDCHIGVRQGDILSPFLFALYINDFELYLRHRYNGICLLPENLRTKMLDSGINVYLRLFSLLYADDTVILAESEKDLQTSLDAIFHYCNIWSLKVNIDKTKVVIFSRGKIRNIPLFNYGNVDLEVVDDYTYLETILNYNNHFSKAQNKQVNQARKAMFSLKMKSQRLNLPVDIELNLFDQIISPILLCGSEIWGFEKNLKQNRNLLYSLL